MAIALLMFMRLIMATNAHPRIALITSTLTRAGSDMVHFFLLFFLVLWGFAIIGSWRFGNSRADMRDAFTAMKTQIDAILGPPGALPIFGDASEDYSYLIFVVLLHFVNFFFLVNFFLAIVVDAFTKTVRSLEDNDTEMDIISDTCEQIYTTTKSWCLWWPDSKKIVYELKRTDRRFLNAEDFASEGFGFRDQEHASTFFNHYKRHSFVLQDASCITDQRVADEYTVLQSKVKAISRTVEKLEPRTPSRSPTGHFDGSPSSSPARRVVVEQAVEQALEACQPLEASLPLMTTRASERSDVVEPSRLQELLEHVQQMRQEFHEARLESAVDRETVSKDRETLIQMAEAMRRDREQCTQLLEVATKLLHATQVQQSCSTMHDVQVSLERHVQEAASMRGAMQALQAGQRPTSDASGSMSRVTAMLGGQAASNSCMSPSGAPGSSGISKPAFTAKLKGH